MPTTRRYSKIPTQHSTRSIGAISKPTVTGIAYHSALVFVVLRFFWRLEQLGLRPPTPPMASQLARLAMQSERGRP